MRRRAALGLLLASPFAARAQLLRGAAEPQDRRGAGAEAALRRTVLLVLRAEARAQTLPAALSDPTPLTSEALARLRIGAKLPDDMPALVLPERINRRLPHKGNASLWAALGDALIEVDPVRLRLYAIAAGVLPPQL